MSARKKPAKGNSQSLPSPSKKRPVARPINIALDTFEPESNENEISDLDVTSKVAEKFENQFSQNPLIAAVQRCLFRRGDVHLTALTNHAYKTEEMRAAILGIFDHEAVQTIGILVIEALLTGNSDFAITVKKAIKEADGICHRDREKELIDRFVPFVWSFGDNIPAKRELIRLFAKRNNGQEPTAQQWRRLRKALNLSEGKTGRPCKTDTES